MIWINAMSKAPTMGTFLYREEEELFHAIKYDDYVMEKSTLTPKRKTKHQKAARNALNDEHVQITLRVSK
jgi:hypothetical protein